MSEITAHHFPTPDLARKSNDPAVQERVSAFAELQAAAARHVRDELLASNWKALAPSRRVELLRTVYQQLKWWRYGIAAATAKEDVRKAGNQFFRPSVQFFKRIVAGDDNYDRLGDLGLLREGATWDPDARTLVGGQSTPASRIVAEMGELALARFDREAPDQDILQNWVLLWHTGDRVRGNRLLRGAAAQAAAEELVDRQRRRGNPVDGFDVGGELLYAATASEDNQVRMHTAALALLADVDNASLEAWCDAVYLLGQAPLDKTGSDAVNRTFAVAVGAVVLDDTPRLVHDVDLRAMVVGQTACIEYLVTANMAV